MNTTTSVAEHEVAEDALRLALGQPYIPDSPGRLDDSGQVVLCAAACFAAAGLERAFGPLDRLHFEREVGRTGDKAVVYQAYARLGWPAVSCTTKMEPNDAARVDERPAVMRAISGRSTSRP